MIEKNTELRKNISKSQIKSDEKYARKKKMVTNVKIIFKTKKKNIVKDIPPTQLM